MTLAIENNLLRSLRDEELAIITPHLSPIEMAAGKLLYLPGDQVQTVYFPSGPAIAGYYIELPDGKGVETALIGREGAVGGIVSHGRLPSYSRCSVQTGGTFLTLRLEALEQIKSDLPSVRALFARYADCLMAQVFQTTACNAGHTINQRAAKWLIASIERTGDQTVRMGQDQLAEMLGIGRSYISRVIGALKRDGILDTRRKQIVVTDFLALSAMACDCNEQVKRHFNDVLTGVYPEAPEETD
jgi:CRP-like cAMP-binding protein